MKLKHSLTIFGLVAMLGLGVGVGLASRNAPVQEAKATNGDTWYYRGTDTIKNQYGWDSHESFGEGYGKLTEAADFVIWPFQNGEQFKICSTIVNWSGTNIDQSKKSGTAVTSGHIAAEGENFKCTYTGFYKIKVASSSSVVIDDIKTLSELTSMSANIYRFTNNENWENVYVHAWNTSDSSHDTHWPGVKLEKYYFNDQNPGQAVNLFLTKYTYTNFIFHNNSNARIETGTIGETKAWYVGSAVEPEAWDGGEKKYTPGTWTPENNTYRYYDYDDSHAGAVRCYAWGSNTGLENGEYNNAAAMTRVTKGEKNTRVYEITVDSMFDKVIFKVAGSEDSSKLTDDVWFNEHSGDVYSSKSFDDSGFFGKHGISFDKALADDWLFNFMHLRDIAHDPEDSDSGDCKATAAGGNNYYADAVASYNALSNDVKTIIAGYGEFYNNAKARLSAWASACGQTATISESAGTYTLTTAPKAGRFVLVPGAIESGNDMALIIIIASSVVTLLAIGGYFYLRKRKEDR